MKRLAVIRSFYLSFAFYTGLISLFSWFLLDMPVFEKFSRFLPLYLLMKIASGTVIWYYIRSNNPTRLFFYRNLSISELRLFLTAFAMDIMSFLIFIFCVHMIISIGIYSF
ncbi:hypothetical protein ACFP1I_00790 [Dyadobacter subterraneus]|uniref:Uncharacterized protein n=1 Tax=Dyadobacter subterraneus TaxID=2773304 RepID=A0ABR9WK90_9BACT|nr:hypothetical protein [Dyadobacter subterraneus]MBE9465927.1 hypothetical protein [Dyadobacter subterraneus]